MGVLKLTEAQHTIEPADRLPAPTPPSPRRVLETALRVSEGRPAMFLDDLSRDEPRASALACLRLQRAGVEPKLFLLQQPVRRAPHVMASVRLDPARAHDPTRWRATGAQRATSSRSSRPRAPCDFDIETPWNALPASRRRGAAAITTWVHRGRSWRKSACSKAPGHLNATARPNRRRCSRKASACQRLLGRAPRGGRRPPVLGASWAGGASSSSGGRPATRRRIETALVDVGPTPDRSASRGRRGASREPGGPPMSRRCTARWVGAAATPNICATSATRIVAEHTRTPFSGRRRRHGGAAAAGGEIVAEGTPKEMKRAATGQRPERRSASRSAAGAAWPALLGLHHVQRAKASRRSSMPT